MTYTPSPGDTLVFEANYAGIDIEHWDKPTVDAQCDVYVNAKSQKYAQELADEVKFDEIKGKRRSGAKVWISNKKSRTIFNGSVERKVKLTVRIPNGYPVRLITTFGDIDGDDFNEGITVSVSYGKIRLGNLNRASFSLQFGELTAGSTNNLALNNQYTTCRLGSVDTLRVSDQFGKITVGHLNAAGLGLSYSNFTCTDLIKSVRANASFANIKLMRLASDFRLVEVNGQYSDLEINISEKAQFDVTTENMTYGKCKIRRMRTQVTSGESEETLGYDSTRQGKSDKKLIRVNGGGKGRIIFDGGGFSNIIINAL